MTLNDVPRTRPVKYPPPGGARRAAALALTAAAVGSIAGCQLWPWGGKVKTSLITPSMRMASIREMAPRARDADEAEQQRLCEQLAQQIRTEPDPIVRKTIQETIGEFDAPLAEAVLLAGLNDDDRDVRAACCRILGRRRETEAIAPLTKLVGSDPELDVRLAAVDALGAMNDRAAIAGLSAALKDRDTAMQYAGVEAMKSITGEDLGNDVQAWRQYADRAAGGEAPAATIAAQSADSAVK